MPKLLHDVDEVNQGQGNNGNNGNNNYTLKSVLSGGIVLLAMGYTVEKAFPQGLKWTREECSVNTALSVALTHIHTEDKAAAAEATEDARATKAAEDAPATKATEEDDDDLEAQFGGPKETRVPSSPLDTMSSASDDSDSDDGGFD